jgi:hypothetical protein
LCHRRVRCQRKTLDFEYVPLAQRRDLSFDFLD